MEFDELVIIVTKLADGRWNMRAQGCKKGLASEVGIADLGSVTSKDRSTLIDWFIEKVEEA